MNKQQYKFEKDVILESDIYDAFDFDGNIYGFENPDLHITPLNELQATNKDNIFKNRLLLYVIINGKLSTLNGLQLQIAELRFINHKSIREIAKEVDKHAATIQYHIKRIKKTLEI